MELKLVNGRYQETRGKLVEVSGTEELAQRLMMKLTARRGAFWPLPEYGSRLYKLVQGERPADREAAIRLYVAEALADEPEAVLESVESEVLSNDSIALRLLFSYADSTLSIAAVIN